MPTRYVSRHRRKIIFPPATSPQFSRTMPPTACSRQHKISDRLKLKAGSSCARGASSRGAWSPRLLTYRGRHGEAVEKAVGRAPGSLARVARDSRLDG